MLDITFIREHQDILAKAAQEKNIKLNVSELLSLDDERRELIQQIETINRQRNEVAEEIKQKGGKPDEILIRKGKDLKEQAAELEPKLKEVMNRFDHLMYLVPNVYPDDTPVGSDDAGNVEIEKWGEPRQFDFEPQDHMTLGERLNLIDTERGTKVAGFRGYYLKNDLVMLQWALFTYCLAKMKQRGFQVMITPTMVRDMALFGSGHFPFGKEEIYPADDKFLAGTSEPSLLAYRADEVVDVKEMPLKYCGISPCYRREIGSYGKDTRGLYRVHEFWKIEQVVLCENDVEVSLPLFEDMLSIAKEILQELKLPYRVLRICTGDMGAGKYKMYDIETWMPSRNSYGETHSCSHLTDWQTRRLNIRYRDNNGVLTHPHAMNNTVIASPRILIALLENYQQADGSIMVPDVLRPFMGGQECITA